MSKHLLVIEDNTEVRENLEAILELSGFKVTTAFDGKDGVEKAVANPPDLILCDVMMPRLDGFGTLNILNQRSETYHIPFIFLTAKTEKADIRRGMNLGADDYITKPFYKDELLRVINIRLKRQEQLNKKVERDETGLTAFINTAKGFSALEQLSNDRKTRDYPKKEMLFYEGDYPRYFYLLQSGQIKLYKTNEYGKELIIRTIQAGEFFGYTALMENSDYTFSAAAIEKSTLVLVPREDFTNLLYANRDVSASFIRLLANNVTAKENQLLSLAYDSVRKRTAEALLKIYNDHGKESELSILREDLARMVGTAKESVIRVLTEFKKDKYIEIKGGGLITILDSEKLEMMPG